MLFFTSPESQAAGAQPCEQGGVAGKGWTTSAGDATALGRVLLLYELAEASAVPEVPLLAASGDAGEAAQLAQRRLQTELCNSRGFWPGLLPRGWAARTPQHWFSEGI